MRRCGARGRKGPCGSKEQGEELTEILWGRTYVATFLRKCAELFKAGCDSNGIAQGIAHQLSSAGRSLLEGALKFSLQTDGA